MESRAGHKSPSGRSSPISNGKRPCGHSLLELVADDVGFYSARGEVAVQNMGVKPISIPNHSTKRDERRRHQKQRWFRKGQKWRTVCEGRISVLKTAARSQPAAAIRNWNET